MTSSISLFIFLTHLTKTKQKNSSYILCLFVTRSILLFLSSELYQAVLTNTSRQNSQPLEDKLHVSYSSVISPGISKIRSNLEISVCAYISKSSDYLKDAIYPSYMISPPQKRELVLFFLQLCHSVLLIGVGKQKEASLLLMATLSLSVCF